MASDDDALATLIGLGLVGAGIFALGNVLVASRDRKAFRDLLAGELGSHAVGLVSAEFGRVGSEGQWTLTVDHPRYGVNALAVRLPSAWEPYSEQARRFILDRVLRWAYPLGA